MKWTIPAKTFLVGEYAALAGLPAILLTTAPCFELIFTESSEVKGIHPASPAGRWWFDHPIPQGLIWRDPYEEKGGVGASSAQFLSVYLASCYWLDRVPNHKALLDAYYQYAWQGEGLRPSGYDLLAQSQNRCVYIDLKQGKIQSYDWPFRDISFLLLHSGQKLATHTHLKTSPRLPQSIEQLSAIVALAHEAFGRVDSEALIQAVKSYQQELLSFGLVAPSSQKWIQVFNSQPDVLAAKGCGALGADVLLLIVPSKELKIKTTNLASEGWDVLATSDDLYPGPALIENKSPKTLEILT